MPRPLVALVLALALAIPLAPGARADDLDPAPVATAAATAGALVLWGGSELAKGSLTPATCRWCDPSGLERHVGDALRWGNPGAAATASDVLVLTLPLALSGADLALAGGDLRRAGEDALVAAEAGALAGVATQFLKFSTGRRRPDAWRAGVRTGPDDDLSFPSNHTSVAFAVAGAFGTVAKLRGYPAWPAVYAAGFAVAAGVGYLRMAGDRHWLGDIAASAALGTASGLLVPWLLHRKAPALAAGVTVTLSAVPLGLAGTF